MSSIIADAFLFDGQGTAASTSLQSESIALRDAELNLGHALLLAFYQAFVQEFSSLSAEEKISSGLLCQLYGNTLIYWDTAPQLTDASCPDHYTIWMQAENALLAEYTSTPGISTIITIILNLSGRPSTHILGNGAQLGMAVALANAFGLNRDPSDWNLSPSERKFRIRIWGLLVVYDRW